MTDFRALLERHGAPLPHAVTMETEVRSEGALMFQKLAVPGWASNLLSSSILTEWSCELQPAEVRDLQAFLKTLSNGISTQQAINVALQTKDIGSYLGTFIEEGMLVAGLATIRILFAYRSASLNTIEDINKAIHDLLTAAPPNLQPGATALSDLRARWEKGTNKREGGLMMLSEINMYDPARYPFTRAKNP